MVMDYFHVLSQNVKRLTIFKRIFFLARAVCQTYIAIIRYSLFDFHMYKRTYFEQGQLGDDKDLSYRV